MIRWFSKFFYGSTPAEFRRALWTRGVGRAAADGRRSIRSISAMGKTLKGRKAIIELPQPTRVLGGGRPACYTRSVRIGSDGKLSAAGRDAG